MARITIAKLKPASPRLNGAVTGEAHAQQVRKIVSEAPPAEADIVVLDYRGIEGASASYLKRLLNPFYGSSDDPGAFTREVSPVAINVDSDDLKEDLGDYLLAKGRVLVVARMKAGRPTFSSLLGRLDGAAAETFKELRELKRTTALQLFEKHAKLTTNQTAWNNRLAQLVEMRLARRGREGRFWIYEPTVTS
jgi:hypothetical protein